MNAVIQQSQIGPESTLNPVALVLGDTTSAARHAELDDISADAAFLKGHAAFQQIRNAVIGNLVQLFGGDYLLSRLLLEEGRFTTFQAVLCLSARQTADERESWLTLGRLQAHLAHSGITSRNRIEALVAIFERYGFLERRKAEEDLRISLLLPSTRMWASDAAFLEAQMAPLALIADVPRWSEKARSAMARLRAGAQSGTQGLDPVAPAWSGRSLGPATAGHRSWRRSFAGHLIAFQEMRATHQSVQALTERDGGYLVLLMMLHQSLVNGSARISMPYEAISESAGVSRTHARLLMEQAEALGFIALRSRGGRDIEVMSAAWEAADDWFADNIAFLIRTV